MNIYHSIHETYTIKISKVNFCLYLNFSYNLYPIYVLIDSILSFHLTVLNFATYLFVTHFN